MRSWVFYVWHCRSSLAWYGPPHQLRRKPRSPSAALEKLPAQNGQQRLLEGAKSEGEALVYANMDVAAMKRLPKDS